MFEGNKEHDEQVTNILYDYERQLPEGPAKKAVGQIIISRVKEFVYTERNEEKSKGLIIRIPMKSLLAFRKVRNEVVKQLETKLNCYVFVVAYRKMIMPRAQYMGRQRPVALSLTAAHHKILEDICAPSSIVGRQIRMHTDGTRTVKIYLDPLDKEVMEDRLDAMTEAYRKLLNKKVKFLFGKPTKSQKALIDFKKKQQEAGN